MRKKTLIICLLFPYLVLMGCGGRCAPAADGTVAVAVEKDPPDREDGLFCTDPIETPGQVWPRVEAARALSDDVLVEKCGLDFIVVLSEWRSPPVDLLQRIVPAELSDFERLSAWIKKNAVSHPRAVEAVVAMDILSGVQVGKCADILAQNQKKWRDLALEVPAVKSVIKEAAVVKALLPGIEEIHLKRCMLEVNPLGFAVSCTPIHPPRQKIDLNWKAETRDGLILNLELTRCSGSASCKELEVVSREFLVLYLRTVDKVETLKIGIFRDQLREWLKLPPFSNGGPG